MTNEFVKAVHDQDHMLNIRIIAKNARVRARIIRVLHEIDRLESLPDYRGLWPKHIAKHLGLPYPFVEQLLTELYDDPDNWAAKLEALVVHSPCGHKSFIGAEVTSTARGTYAPVSGRARSDSRKGSIGEGRS